MEAQDPFTGEWVYQLERSTSTGPNVERWIQRIEVTGDEVRVREEVIVATGQRANVSLQAKFDGRDYPVTGSSLSDAIAYTRLGPREIVGTGKKNGGVTLRETITAEADGQTLTLAFAIFSGEREIMIGVAVFARADA